MSLLCLNGSSLCLQKKRQQNLKTGVAAAMWSVGLSMSGTCYMGAISAVFWGRGRALDPVKKKTEVPGYVKFTKNLWYQHLKLFVAILNTVFSSMHREEIYFFPGKTII